MKEGGLRVAKNENQQMLLSPFFKQNGSMINGRDSTLYTPSSLMSWCHFLQIGGYACGPPDPATENGWISLNSLDTEFIWAGVRGLGVISF